MKQRFILKFFVSVLLVFAYYSKAIALDTLNAGNPVVYSVYDYSEWTHTDVNNSNIDEAEKILKSGGFKKFENDSYAQNSVGKSLWIHLIFRNTSNETKNFLWTIARNKSTVTAYEKINGEYKRVDSVSAHTPYSKRSYPMYLLVTQWPTDSGVVRDIMLRIKPTDKVTLWMQQSFNTELQVRLDQIAYGKRFVPFASSLLFLCFLNLILAYIYKTWLFIWQAIYILLVFIFNGYEHHLLLAIPDIFYGWASNINKLAWLNAAGTAAIFVYIRMTRLLLIAPAIHSFLVKSIYIYLVCFWQMMLLQLLMPLFTDNMLAYGDIRYLSMAIANYASEIMMFIIFIISLLIFKRVNVSTRIFIIAFIFTLLSAIGYASNGFWGIIENTWLQPRILIIGLVTEIFLFTGISFYQIYQAHNERTFLLDQNLAFQKTLTQEIINVREIERKRIAQDLHDDIGGTLGALKMHISSPDMDKQRAFALISKAIADLRQISHNLLPPPKQGDLPFQSIIEQIKEINNLAVLQIKNGIEELNITLPAIVEITVSRIVSELLTNILKHAKATEAMVQIHAEDNILQVIVEDNGIGFDTHAQSLGIGIRNIVSRVEFLKGKINIDSNQYGTTIIIEVPLNTST